MHSITDELLNELKNAKDKKEISMAKNRIQRELTREAVKTEKELEFIEMPEVKSEQPKVYTKTL